MRRIGFSIALAPFAAGLLALGCSPGDTEALGDAQLALGQALGAESEPNGTVANATPITKDGVVRANVIPDGDQDLFSFAGVAGERVYAATMTSFSPGSSDSQLELLAPDGTTVIESDNDDGSFGTTASSIAGAALTQTGTHFLRVKHPTGVGTLRPYDLHLKTQTGAPAAEAEPNDLPASAQPLPASGWVAGAISVGTDVDIYSIVLNAGDTVFASLDLDPERDGTELLGALSIGPFANTFLQVNDAGSIGPDSEALFATVKTAGLYGIGVSAPLATTGNYRLSVSVHPAAQVPSCTTYTSAAVIAIPTGPGAVTSTITVPGNPRIADLDVSVNLTHANMPDLDVMLQAPSGNMVGLFTDVGSATFPNLDVRVDDEAAFPFGMTNILNGLSVEPESAYRLDWFDGQDAGGTWTLRIADDTAANSGTLTSWSITVCEPQPAPTCPNGNATLTPFQTDFEAGDAGFTHSGTADSWARGTPSQAPSFVGCNGGTGCFKTNLSGNYGLSSTQNLVSPAIDLAGLQGPVRLSWAMKYQMESATFDHASVDIREVGGLNPRRLWEWTGATMQTDIGSPSVTVQEVAGWGLYTADVSAYAGKNVELVFHLDSDNTVTFPGLVVDDVKVTACPGQVCGNGAAEGTEQCDDANAVNGDGCDNNCKTTACGNGVLTAGESCDDGNVVSGDGCDSNCKPTGCANGVVTMGEECDDGNVVSGDGCDVNCKITACGNAIVTMGELCDDGNLLSGDGCDANCTVTGCGNGVVTLGELCDDGNAVNGDGCDDGVAGNCTVSACGNDVSAGTEGCDDGNVVDGDGCDSNCTVTGCGNGVVTLGEMCDEGNQINGDGCDDGVAGNCTTSACGNGVQAGGEGCDDGNLVDGDGCDSNCTVTGCTNGQLTDPEECDDGNQASGDGCDNNCTTTKCGNEVQTDPEQCDDGNLVEGDGCDTNCKVSGCGNGVQDPSEGCDDGNVVDGDGCSGTCTVEGQGGSGGSGGGATGGSGGSSTGGAGSGGGGAGGSGTTGAGGATTGTGGAGTGGDSMQAEGGCACSLPGDEPSSTPWAPALALAGLGLLQLRRRRA